MPKQPRRAEKGKQRELARAANNPPGNLTPEPHKDEAGAKSSPPFQAPSRTAPRETSKPPTTLTGIKEEKEGTPFSLVGKQQVGMGQVEERLRSLITSQPLVKKGLRPPTTSQPLVEKGLRPPTTSQPLVEKGLRSPTTSQTLVEGRLLSPNTSPHSDGLAGKSGSRRSIKDPSGGDETDKLAGSAPTPATPLKKTTPPPLLSPTTSPHSDGLAGESGWGGVELNLIKPSLLPPTSRREAGLSY